MPLIDDDQFGDCQPTGFTLDIRGPLGALAGLATQRSWMHHNRSTDAAVKTLVEWYKYACAVVGKKPSKADNKTQRVYTHVRTRLKEWLAEKRQCLEIALNVGHIPRIDVLQQVVRAQPIARIPGCDSD